MNQDPAKTEAALNMEVLPPSTIEALERAHIDVQIVTAHRFPRSLEIFQKRAMEMVSLDAEIAQSCIYRRPVGRQADGKQKFVEGESIRLAEIVAACYGNFRAGARITEQHPTYVKCEGVAHDLETNNAIKSEVIEPTIYKDGKPYDERMRIVVAKAALSKALRDATFRVVPKALCKPVLEAARKVISGESKTIEQRRKKVGDWLASIRVSEARAFAALGVKGWSEVGEEQLETLTGLKTAIGDNDVSVDEAFPAVPKKPEATDLQKAKEPAKTAEAKPSKMPQDDSGVDKTPPTEPKQAAGGKAEEPSPAKSPDEAEEAAAGLAPQSPQTPGEFKAKAGEIEACTRVRKLLHDSGKTEAQLMALLVKKRSAKDGQKLADLSETKLNNVATAFNSLLGEIK